jgi:hypothetical protein
MYLVTVDTPFIGAAHESSIPAARGSLKKRKLPEHVQAVTVPLRQQAAAEVLDISMQSQGQSSCEHMRIVKSHCPEQPVFDVRPAFLFHRIVRSQCTTTLTTQNAAGHDGPTACQIRPG